MISFIGLRLEPALTLAETAGMQVTITRYAAPGGVKNSDSDIVIRERIADGRAELVVSAFKTKVEA